MPTLHKNHTPVFDFNELIAELEIPFNKRQPLKPLNAGSYVHGFSLQKENINSQLAFKNGGIQSSVVLRKLAGKPLVISFYSAQWQQYGLNHLKQLNQLQNEIKALGANILVITPDAIDNTLTELIWNNSLYLNFYHDKDKAIAKQFKVYADHDPVWNRYPGIEVNTPLLATFVLDTANQVIFSHVDETLEEGIIPNGIFKTLNNNKHAFQLNSRSA